MYVLSPSGSILSSTLLKPYLPKSSHCFPFFFQANGKRKAGPVIYSHGMESCLGHRTTNTSLKTAASTLDNEAGTTPRCVVLDVEGTTIPISFVTDVLFPYARDNVRMHIDKTFDSADTKDDIKLLRCQVDDDLQKGVVGAVPGPSDDAGKEEVIDALVANVEGMIKADRKITSLKQLQGHIWRTGFQKNDLKGVVYDDVPEALERWHASGVKGCSDQQKTKLHVSVLERGIMRLGATISVILVIIQLTSPVPLPGWDVSFLPPAKAVLYSPDTKVPRTGELALRKAIPANANMKSIQNSLEELSYLLRIPQRKPYGTMESNVKKALKIAVDEKESILASVPADQKEKGLEIYTSLTDGKGGLQTLLGYIKEKDPDRVSVALASSLDSIAQLELLQAPALSFLLPAQYTNYPRLTGRAVVELVIEKGDGSMFTPQSGGVPRKAAMVQVVLDGYSAPLTTGNFAKLVVDGAYDGMKFKCTDQAILLDSGIDKNIGYSVPLEIMPSGQFEPLYKTTLSIQDGELPVLPLSVYGAVAMAHDDASEEYSSPNQFFFYLYDKSYSGLGGLSFDEGQFSVFGYTTIGRDILPQIKTGDVVRSAKLVEGQDNLVLPAEKI